MINEDPGCEEPEKTWEWEEDWECVRKVPDWEFHGKKLVGYDFFKNRSRALTAAGRHNLGWQTRLELDEFPLEIQCQRCFW